MPAQLRRRAHAVSRIRPCAARHAVRRDLSAVLGHECRPRFRRVSLAALRALAGAAGNLAPLRAAYTRPAIRCRRRCSQSCSAARRFNQGFATVEYHRVRAGRSWRCISSRRPATIDVVAFERAELAGVGMPDAIAHAPPHAAFPAHLFGRIYSAGYYSYLWSEILDADGFEAFRGERRHFRRRRRAAVA